MDSFVKRNRGTCKSIQMAIRGSILLPHFFWGNIMKFENGSIGYINFKYAVGGEINKIHLAVLYNIPRINNVIFAIPLTSPKEKHFKTIEDFKNRNFLEIKYFRLHYIKQTDSIALLEQIKSISRERIIKICNDLDQEHIVLSKEEQSFLNAHAKKYISLILNDISKIISCKIGLNVIISN